MRPVPRGWRHIPARAGARDRGDVPGDGHARLCAHAPLPDDYRSFLSWTDYNAYNIFLWLDKHIVQKRSSKVARKTVALMVEHSLELFMWLRLAKSNGLCAIGKDLPMTFFERDLMAVSALRTSRVAWAGLGSALLRQARSQAIAKSYTSFWRGLVGAALVGEQAMSPLF